MTDKATVSAVVYAARDAMRESLRLGVAGDLDGAAGIIYGVVRDNGVAGVAAACNTLALEQVRWALGDERLPDAMYAEVRVHAGDGSRETPDTRWVSDFMNTYARMDLDGCQAMLLGLASMSTNELGRKLATLYRVTLNSMEFMPRGYASASARIRCEEAGHQHG